MEMMYDAQLWIIMVALVAAILYMKRLAAQDGYAKGYVQGISSGFAYGIEQVSEILVTSDVDELIKHKHNKSLSKDELVELLVPIATANLVDKINKARQ